MGELLWLMYLEMEFLGLRGWLSVHNTILDIVKFFSLLGYFQLQITEQMNCLGNLLNTQMATVLSPGNPHSVGSC